jgi:hypothetical protein
MAVASGANTRIALKKQTTAGVAATGNFILIPAVSLRMGQQQTFLPNDLIGQGRDPARPSRDVSETTGQAVLPVDLRAIGYWLSMIFGAPITTGAGPYTHEWRSGGLATDLYSIEQQHPDLATPRYFLNKDVTGDGFDLELAPNGQLQMTFDLSYGAQTPSSSSGAGTPTSVAVVRFSQFENYINLNGTALGKIVRARMPFRNQLDKIRYVGGAGAVGDTAPGSTESRGQLTARFADNTLVQLALDQTTFSLEVGFEKSASQKLSFKLEQAEIATTGSPPAGAGAIELVLDLIGSKAASPSRMMTVTLINDIASYA